MTIEDPVVLTTPPPDDDPVPRLGVEGEGGNVSPAAVCPVQRVLLGVQGEVLGLIHHAVYSHIDTTLEMPPFGSSLLKLFLCQRIFDNQGRD